MAVHRREVRQRNGHWHGPESFEDRAARGPSLRHGRRELDLLGQARNSDPKRLDALAKGAAHLRHRNGDAVAVARIVTGDRFEEKRAVGGRARKRPDMIERPGARHRAVAADAPIARHQAANAVQRGGKADRAARVRSQRAEHDAGRDRCAGTAGGSARDVG